MFVNNIGNFTLYSLNLSAITFLHTIFSFQPLIFFIEFFFYHWPPSNIWYFMVYYKVDRRKKRGFWNLTWRVQMFVCRKNLPCYGINFSSRLDVCVWPFRLCMEQHHEKQNSIKWKAIKFNFALSPLISIYDRRTTYRKMR